MMNSEIVGARDFRRDFTRHLTAAQYRQTATVVTRYGEPVAILLPRGTLLDLTAELTVLRELLENESAGEAERHLVEMVSTPEPEGGGGRGERLAEDR